MNKLLSFICSVLVLISFDTNAWEQRKPNPVEQCKIHQPFGFSKSEKQTSEICRQAYYVAYDANAKIPAFVSYNLTPEHALGCVERSNEFATDKSIENGATPEDYVGAGYDKGHMAPDGDLSWSQQVELESFLMTNMTPQLPGLNRGIWKLLETNVRGWAVQMKQPFTIMSGSIYNDKDKKIGKGVVVPNSFYKVVINNETKQYAGWLFPQAENLGKDITKYRAKIDDIVKKANVEISLPEEGTELKVGDEWPVNIGSVTKARKDVCGIVVRVN
jgi:endonuclease G